MKGTLWFILGIVFGSFLAEVLYLFGVSRGLREERSQIVKWLKTEQCPECLEMVDRMIDYVERKEHWKKVR